MMKKLIVLALLAACCPRKPAAPDFSVTIGGKPRAQVIVLCQALATKESGPAETVVHFGEVYAFTPSSLSVRKGEPTEIVFWNLQADDEHDFMLFDPRNRVVTQFKLPPLQKTARVFTFRGEGLYRFVCTLHRPEMSGAITVGPPAV